MGAVGVENEMRIYAQTLNLDDEFSNIVYSNVSKRSTSTITKTTKLPIQVMAKEYAKQQLSFRGYRSHNWTCLHSLWTKESNWNHKADNPKSSAFGIAQRLNEKSKDYVTQINNGLRYIEHRYGSPCGAWEFWTKMKWY